MVKRDGSMSLVDLDAKRIHWIYKSGVPIHKSYHTLHNVGPYIDVGPGWELYGHDKSKNICEVRTRFVCSIYSLHMYAIF